ncbi:unnamed protein product [Caenorhabditis bovis]|uniref:G-protein coupled receptors family 1 profile domain-containing protein n=1 Tax=Caenorhabditis bovis TaxID=2654633 RepID=A0A8S1EIB8_9PELO|nr:unnamed protein product [Caenorhabditis bovis]
MSSNSTNRVGLVDVLIFGGLESVGVCAIVGNLALIIVLLNNKYLHRASFILMLNLAIADVIHGFVTTCHFYPPILLQKMHIGELAIRLFNITDWTAWAITLTHMSAICIDRLIAIILYGRYNVLVTVQRIRTFSISCWIVFLSTNVTLFFLHACCMIRPLESLNYYSFGYSETKKFNVYVLTYTPLEILTILILSFSNPITLVQLYRRHKRKIALRQASTMLLEMSMKMGSKHLTNDVREMAGRRANRQQQRILLQITVVALIFYGYMTAYYISYYSRFQSTAVMIFNSYFYSITHMINPVIYFSLNKEMRAQFKSAIKDFIKWFDCKKKDPYGFANSSTKVNHSTKITATAHRSESCSETSPLFSSNNHYKSTCRIQKDVPSIDEETGNESAEIQAIVDNASQEQSDQCSSPQSDEYVFPPSDLPTNKMNAKDRSAFINQLVSALKFTSSKSLSKENHEDERPRRKLDKSATTSDINSIIKQKYIHFSNTIQVISRDSIGNLMPENKFMSIGSLEGSCLLNDVSGSISESTSATNNKSSNLTRSSSTSSRTMFDTSTNFESGTALLIRGEAELDVDDDDEIAYL